MTAAGSGARAAGDGLPLLPFALLGSTVGGAFLAGFLVVKRRLFFAVVVALLGVTVASASSPPAALAQTDQTTGPSRTTAEAVATFSGLPASVEVIDVDPPIDFDSEESPDLQSPLTITKHLDRSSPNLIDAVVTGEAFRCVEFRFPADGDEAAQAMLALSNVRVGAVHHVAESAEPTERVELHFERVAFRYWPDTGSRARGRSVEGVLP